MGAGSGSVRARTTTWRLRRAKSSPRSIRLTEGVPTTPTASSVARTPRRSGSPIFRQPTPVQHGRAAVEPTADGSAGRSRPGVGWASPPGEPAPAPPAEPVPAPPAGDTVQTWLNAELDGDPNRFRVDGSRLFSVFFDVARSRHAVAAAPTPVAIPAEDETLDLTVQVASSDFSVPPFPQQLRLRRDGKSMNRAFFEITPLHAGRVAERPRRCEGQFPAAPGHVVRCRRRCGTRRRDLRTPGGGRCRAGRAGGDAADHARGRRIRRSSHREWSPNPVQIWITPDELEARIEGVRSTLLASVSKEENAFHIDLAAAKRDALLRQLAFEGFLLYQAIFAGPNASPELKSIGKWLRESLVAEVTTLQVVSIGFPVPWPMMYLADRFDANPLSWDNFIGMRHVVEQIPMAHSTRCRPRPRSLDARAQRARPVQRRDRRVDAVAPRRGPARLLGIARRDADGGNTRRRPAEGRARRWRDGQGALPVLPRGGKPKDPADSQLILSGDEA